MEYQHVKKGNENSIMNSGKKAYTLGIIKYALAKIIILESHIEPFPS